MVRSTTCVLRYPSAVYGGPSHPGISWGSSMLMSVVLGGAKTAQARRATRPLPSERCPPPPACTSSGRDMEHAAEVTTADAA